MSVWLTIPSARPPEEAEKVLKLWRSQGYKIALYIDADPNLEPWEAADRALTDRDPEDIYIVSRVYPGYSAAVNRLIVQVAENFPDAEWFVIGGDDVEPDKNNTADEIVWQLAKAFGLGNTMAVMQPTGDRFAQGSIDHIAGSAWIGREFARRMYGGKGPLWPEYTRFFMDEELQAVAKKYGVFQQRRDLIHLHRWYARADDSLTSTTKPTPMPKHLKHQEAKWTPEREIFQRRKAAGFPGSEPIA